MIVETSFEEIYKIWLDYLWPNRISKIESHSAMMLDKTYNLENFKYKATYFFYMLDTKVVGCNSGHMCADNTYRSRGLYVFSEYRNRGIGQKLLEKTIHQGQKEKSTLVWSYPRKSSWSSYKNAGFTLINDWEISELGHNAYCKLTLKESVYEE